MPVSNELYSKSESVWISRGLRGGRSGWGWRGDCGPARELRSNVVILIPDAGEGRHCNLPGDSGIAAGEAGADVTVSKKHNAFVNALKSGVTGYVQMYSGK